MKKKLALALVFLSVNLMWSQPVLQWEAEHKGFSTDKGIDIVVDKSGNSYVTGTSYGASTGFDILTIKYNSFGDTLWTNRFNGAANQWDEPFKIEIDYLGFIYVVGKTKTKSNGFDIVTIKYNQQGTVLWKNFYNGSFNGDDLPLNLATDKIGNVYVTGKSNFSEVVIKYNSVGALEWSRVAPGKLIAINNNDGNIIVVSESDYYNPYIILALRPSDGQVVQQYNSHETNYRNGKTSSLLLDVRGNIYVTSTSTEITSSNPHTVLTQKFDYPGTANERYGAWFSTSISGSGTISGVETVMDDQLNFYVLADLFTGSHHDYYIKKYNMLTNELIWKLQYNSNSSADDIPVSIALSNKVDPDIFVTGYSNLGNINTIVIGSTGILNGEVLYDCGSGKMDVVSEMIMDLNDNLFLTGYSNCGSTSEDVKTIKYCTTAPPRPDPIIGGTEVCLKIAEMFQVEKVAGAVDYTWSLPKGWVILSGEKTNKINVLPGVSGTISVTANSLLCSSLHRELHVTVYPKPSIMGSIAGDTAICDLDPHVYSIAPIKEAENYVWILPQGWTGNSTLNEIEIWPNGISGTLKVFAVNICGNSDTVELQIIVNSIPTKPDSIMGHTKICPNTIQNYFIMPVPGSTFYVWNVPRGWAIIGDSTKSEIMVRCNSNDGELSVTAKNICGNSILQKIEIKVLNMPSKPGVINGESRICQGTTNIYSITPIQHAESYKWTLPNGINGNNSTIHEIITYADSLNGGNITVVALNKCFVSDTQPKFVSLTNIDNTITINGGTLISNDAGVGVSYQWLDCSTKQDIPGATAQSFTPIYTGNFAVRVSKASCEEVSKCYLITDQLDYSSSYSIDIYPNPTSSLLNITMLDIVDHELVHIELQDIFGKSLLTRTIKPIQGKFEIQLDIENCASGTYLLNINSKRIKFIKKIVKQE